ncbi:phage tail sheath subtilisin-like domain-containing protein [uncultured Kiloniella sp.]|uniref:phage tail sheath subtilisin-like domain-containing protein n=1 Tax=uncultured Kiloniella sp. TaxID=1133091 RepID=UPI00262979E6|nr:phage tail sheath subtilisin-like domain-containing protein [uncultured Kiloniella sp.]
MSISFNQMPADIRVPLFYAEVDNSQAFSFEGNYRALLIGQRFAVAPIAVNTPVLVSSADQAGQYFGKGSMLHRMVTAYIKNNDYTELWCVALDDDGSGVAATGSIKVDAGASASGTDNLYIAGQRIRYGVASTDTPAALATAIAAAITADSNLPVAAVVNGSDNSQVDFTARHKGEVGNGIDIRRNYYGVVGGEVSPTGLDISITAMSGGSGNPDISTAVAAVGDEPYRFIGMAYTDAANLAVMQTFLDDVTGRWSPLQQNYSHCFTARSDTLGSLNTFGETRNDPHTTCYGVYDSPTPTYEAAAIWTGIAAKHISIDPARPLQTLPMVGFLSPPEASRFTISERNILLHSGIATSYVEGGYSRIERAITTYQENSYGEPDASYLDANTLFTLAYVLDYLRAGITQKYPRHKLANDGTRFGAGQAIVTPKIIKAEIIASYGRLEERALVENREAFIDNLIVERSSSNPSRVDVLFPPDLVNQLRILAVLAQFRLQYNAN